jgi:hypothetical protein
MAFNFGEVISRAWQITWKYKILWIFGILAGCGRGGGGSNSSYQFSQDQTNQNMQPYLDQAGRWLEANWWVVVVLILVFLLLMLLTIFLGTIGRIGLIRGTLQAETGAGPLSFSGIFQDSMPHFWPVFLLSLVIGLIFFVIFGGLAVGAIVGGMLTFGVGLICLLPLFCVLFLVAIVVGVIVEQANVAIVKEHLGLVEGWKRGWGVVRANPGPIIVMALILGVIGFVIGLIIVIPIFIIMIPAAIGFMAANGQNWTPMLIAGGLFLLYLPILLLLQGILTTFTGAAWTLTYLRLTAPPVDNTPVVVEANA